LDFEAQQRRQQQRRQQQPQQQQDPAHEYRVYMLGNVHYAQTTGQYNSDDRNARMVSNDGKYPLGQLYPDIQHMYFLPAM